MAKRKINLIAVLLLLIAVLVSCSTGIASDGTSETRNTTDSQNTVSVSTDAGNLYPETYNEEDYTSWKTYDFGTEYVFDVSTKTWVGASPADSGVAKVTLKDNSLKVSNKADSAINIRLTGSDSSFKVVIEGNSQPVKLTLEDLSLTSDDRAVNVKASEVTYIVLEGENSLETNINSYDKNVLKSAADMIIDGTGSLSVTANSKNGIVSDSVIAVLDGDITVTVAEKTFYTDDNDTEDDTSDDVVEETKGTAIKPYLGFVMLGGKLTIYGNNSDTYYEAKGIKVDGYDEEEGIDESLSAGMGWIVIDGGTLTVTTQGKAISAGYDGDDGVPTSSAYYPVPNVYINGGDITVTTLHAPREDSRNADDGVSPEGIEAKNNMYITGGTIVLNTTDDCLNASEEIYISGGYIYAYASQNDAIDAGSQENQGGLYISGGVVVALGAGAPEGGLDCNSNARFQYTGGLIIAMGGSNNVPQASGTTAYTVSAGNVSAGTSYALVQDGEVILAFKVPSTYRSGSSVLIGSGDLEQGSATLISGATVSSDSMFNNTVYLGSVSVSGGTSSDVTVSNTSSGGFGGGGFPGGGFPGGGFPGGGFPGGGFPGGGQGTRPF